MNTVHTGFMPNTYTAYLDRVDMIAFCTCSIQWFLSYYFNFSLLTRNWLLLISFLAMHPLFIPVCVRPQPFAYQQHEMTLFFYTASHSRIFCKQQPNFARMWQFFSSNFSRIAIFSFITFFVSAYNCVEKTDIFVFIHLIRVLLIQ